MATTGHASLIKQFWGLFQALAGDITEDQCRSVFRSITRVSTIAADNTANAALTLIGPAPVRWQLTAANWQGSSTLAADVTSYAKVELIKTTTNGTTTSLVGRLSNDTVAFTSGVARDLTLVTNGNTVFLLGESLWYQIVKSQTVTNVAVTVGAFGITTEELDAV